MSIYYNRNKKLELNQGVIMDALQEAFRRGQMENVAIDTIPSTSECAAHDILKTLIIAAKTFINSDGFNGGK